MIIDIKNKYYKELDKKAEELARRLNNNQTISKDILDILHQIYLGTNLEKSFSQGKDFYSAYHPPATSDFEFIISRILVYYSRINKLGWIILLRKQEKKLAPDIRIEKNGKTIAIIEIKIKVGWMQGLFSDKRAEYDRKRKIDGKTDFDIDKKIKDEKNRILKLINGFKIQKERIIYLIPSLREAHRKKYNEVVDYYKEIFERNFELPKENLVLLSDNLRLDLDREVSSEDYHPTEEFEKFIKSLR